MNTMEFKRFLDAVVLATKHVEGLGACSSWEQYEYLEDTLVELLELHSDCCKPAAEEAARRQKASE